MSDDALPPAGEPLARALAAAAEGLVFSSEGDHPFEAFHLPAPAGSEAADAAALAALLGPEAGPPAGERDLDDLLLHHTDTIVPQDEEGHRLRPRYERLKKLLRASLRDVRVLRVGRTQVGCYLVGTDAEGGLTGLKTVAIET